MDLFRRLFNQSEPPNQEEEAKPATTDSSASAESQDSLSETQPLETMSSSVDDGTTRPLPIESVIATKNEHLRFGQSTDVGMVRSNNQDSVLSHFTTSRSAEDYPDFGLFLVADGMGGHQDGEKASALTARIVASQITKDVFMPVLLGEPNGDRPPITEMLIDAVQKANAHIIEHVPEGGTTLTAVTIISDLAYIVHVGDSRAYLITRDGLEQLTRDHSLVARLIELDQLRPEEVADHHQKNVLYRALGQSDNLEVDAVTRRLPPNSRLLICSDGLWNQVEDDEILEIVLSHDNPQEACDKLVALANTRGGTDNITTILLQIPGN
jgi:protein phosphatase